MMFVFRIAFGRPKTFYVLKRNAINLQLNILYIEVAVAKLIG